MGKRKRHKPASKSPTANPRRAKGRRRTKVMSEPTLAPIAQAATQAPIPDEQPNTSSTRNDWGSPDRHRRHPDAALAQTSCETCGWYHQGDSQETLDSLVKLSEEAAVLFDRDVATERKVAELCGPRFRQSGFSIDAHYGHPRGQRYVVHRWTPADERWRLVVDSNPEREPEAETEAAARIDLLRVLSLGCAITTGEQTDGVRRDRGGRRSKKNAKRSV